VQMPVLRLSIPDCFVTHGAMDKLLAEVGLTPEGVRDAVVGRLLDTNDLSTIFKDEANDAASSRRRTR
jgi:deoxyxylulose-5-phosphate synthase